MPLHLLAPGERRDNKFFIVRGRLDGKLVELTTKTTKLPEAKRFLKEFEKRYREIGEPAMRLRRGSPRVLTFSEAAELYRAANPGLGKPSLRYLRRLEEVIGQRFITELTHADMAQAAEQLYPQAMGATKNRQVLRPFGSVMHYAAANRLTPYERYKPFKEPKPRHRAVTRETAAALVAGAQEPRQRLFIMWLFHQGMRVTDALQVRWMGPWDQHDHLGIDMREKLVWVRVGKTDQLMAQPLHPEIIVELVSIPASERYGKLFSWGSRQNVYRWLRPIADSLGIHFTPHMARHSLGTWLDQIGASNRSIMTALGHADVRSSMRYRAGDIETVRAAQRQLGGFGTGARDEA